MTNATPRNMNLRSILIDRRNLLDENVQSRIREDRADRPNEGGDELERSDADISEDVGYALLQMKAETVRRIDEALVRLDAGEYGSCFECASAISETRLRALPFAVRCRACEEKREQGQVEARRIAKRQASPLAFAW